MASENLERRAPNPRHMISATLSKQRLELAARLCRKFRLDIATFPEAPGVIESLYERGRFREILLAFRHVGIFGPYSDAHLLERLAHSGNAVAILKATAKDGREVPRPVVLDALRSRVDQLLRKGALVRAARVCRRHGVRPDTLPGVNEAVEVAVQRGQAQIVLSAFYEAGAFGTHTVDELLRLLSKSNMPAAFLKNAYRFGVRVGFEPEIDAAIQWHRDRGMKDADAWQQKFERLIGLPAAPPALSEARATSVVRLQPVYPSLKGTAPPLPEASRGVDSDPYILSQVSRAKLEKATTEHQRALSVLERCLSNEGLTLSNSKLIDLLGEGDGWIGIFEVKSITPDNERDQVRHAVSQLFEYRFLHQLPSADLFVVFSGEPFSGWLVDYLRQLGIGVIWINAERIDGPDAIRATRRIRGVPMPAKQSPLSAD